MAEQMYVAADEIMVGDFIPGLDNAYVIEVEETDRIVNEYNISLSRGNVFVTYNDADGDEGYLILTPTTRIEILRQ